MMTTCDACGKRFGFGDRRGTTMTGRTVHQDCQDRLTAAAAGMMAGGGSPVADAIATQGWFDRFRHWRRDRRR